MNVSNVPLNKLAIYLLEGKKGTAAVLLNAVFLHIFNFLDFFLERNTK